MTIALAVVVALLLLDRQWTARQNARERKTMVNALVARDGRELAILDRDPKPIRERPAEVSGVDFPAGY